MTMNEQDHGSRPAFPFMHELPDGFGSEVFHAPGLDTRTYLAAHALAGLLAAHSGDCALPDSDVAARKAVRLADALLLELAKPKGTP
jgi:hypothetical protein